MAVFHATERRQMAGVLGAELAERFREAVLDILGPDAALASRPTSPVSRPG
jgi:hypothetical protein